MRHHHEVALVVLAACAHSPHEAAPAPDVTYTVQLREHGVEVAIDAPSSPDGNTVFAIEPWAGVSNPEVAIQGVAGSGEVSHPTATTWSVHDARPRVSIHYTLASAPLELDNRFRPLVSAHVVHFIGNTALLHPRSVTGSKRVRFAWLGFDGWRAASSHGTGPLVDYTGPLELFRDAVFFASDGLRVTTRPVGRGEVVLAITGEWPFTDAQLLDRIAAIVAMERAFFADPGPPRFVVTLIQLGDQGGNYGGTGLTTSFSLAMNQGSRLDNSISELVAHEHFHTWDGQTIVPDGPDDLAFWFTEGFTQFYTWRLLYRAGMVTIDDFAAELDRTVLWYTATPARELPNANIGEAFWTSVDVDKLPYMRGALVATVLDREIRRASNGTRSLDDLMRALVAEGRAGEQVTTETLLARFAAETSPAFAATLRATIVDGATLAIDPSGLEPCLSGSVGKRPAFELGFSPSSVTDHQVHGLVPGSAAERAGLRDGDHLDHMDIQFGDPDRPVKLVVGGHRLSYVPRRELDALAFTVHDRTACAAVLGGAVSASAR